MAETSTIEWTDATWNPITGCSIVSPGCTNCYAMKLAGTRLQHHPSRAGLTKPSKAGPVWTGEVRFNEEWLDQPLRWKRPRRIFVCAHGDLFHESVPDEWIDRVFAVMALAPHHTFQVLTKRAERMRGYLTDDDLNHRISAALGSMLDGDWIWDHSRLRPAIDGLIDAFIGHRMTDDDLVEYLPAPMPLPNVWLGVSAEDQARADQRIPHLLETPAAVRFVSLEPLLGAINLNGLYSQFVLEGGGIEQRWDSCLDGRRFNIWSESDDDAPRLDWVIVGGESGPGAGPMHPDWLRSLRDQCTTAGVPFFFKQWGEWAPGESAGKPKTYEIGFWVDGRWHMDRETAKQAEDGNFDEEPDVYRVGKKAAGATLDGREWREMPQ